VSAEILARSRAEVRRGKKIFSAPPPPKKYILENRQRFFKRTAHLWRNELNISSSN